MRLLCCFLLGFSVAVFAIHSHNDGVRAVKHRSSLGGHHHPSAEELAGVDEMAEIEWAVRFAASHDDTWMRAFALDVSTHLLVGGATSFTYERRAHKHGTGHHTALFKSANGVPHGRVAIQLGSEQRRTDAHRYGVEWFERQHTRVRKPRLST